MPDKSSMTEKVLSLILIIIPIVAFSEELPRIFVKPRYVIKKESSNTFEVQSVSPDDNKSKNFKTLSKEKSEIRKPASAEMGVSLEDSKVTNDKNLSSNNSTEMSKETVKTEAANNLPSSNEIQKTQAKLIKDVSEKTIELYLMSYFQYNDSTSNYSYRTYNSFFNALELGGKINITESVGVNALYNFSIGADVDGDRASHSKSFVKYNDLQTAISFKIRPNNSSVDVVPVELNILYLDKRMILPTDDVDRVSLKSSGLGIGVKTPLDQNRKPLWDLDISFFPNLQHKEDGTALNMSSGNHKQSSLSEIGINHILFENDRNKLFLRTELQIEKNYFDGPATLQDPKTSNTPSNVSVTNSSLKFSLGFSWGK